MISKQNCCGCSACSISCPYHCIEMKYDSEGFLYPVTDIDKCISCGLCDEVCPFEQKTKIVDEPIAMGAFCKDREIRYNSSSGGIFSIIARYTINHGGLVCGVIYDTVEQKAKHVLIDNIQDIKKLQGSKYIQSELNDVFVEIRMALKTGRLVVFSGTSCQVAGLKSYLRKEYDNLIMVEVICHGVPSTLLWHKYVDYVEKKEKKKIDLVRFRSKKYSWTDFGIDTMFKSQDHKFEFSFENPFFRLFNSNLCLRPSCYKCKVKGLNTKADISLGDFWHIEEINPKLNDGKGLSLVLLCTAKGKKMLEQISKEIQVINEPINYKEACKYNPAIDKSMQMSAKREIFFEDMLKMDFIRLSNKYSPQSLKIVLKGMLLRVKSRIPGGGYK